MTTTVEKTENKTGYKKTYLGHIPEDWNIFEFGKLIDYTKGYAFKSSEYKTEGIRIIRVGDTTYDSIKEENPIYINENNKEQYKKWLLKANDIVFSTVGSRPPAYDSMVGKAILVKNKFEGCLLNQNAVLIRTRSNKKCFQRFLYYHFKTSRYLDYIETIIRGNANQVSITLEDLFKYKITLPTSEIEQQKIVKVISCWDDAIEKTEKLISAKTQFKKALMQKLLTGKIRFGEFVKSTESLNGKYYPYPKDWKYLEIRQIAKESSAKNSDNKDLTVLSCTKYKGLVNSLDYFGKQIFSKDLSTYRIVKRNQFAYATNHIEEGSIGYQNLHDEALISPMYTVFQANQDLVDDGFLYKILKTEMYRQIFAGSMNASVDRRGSLRWKEFSKIHIAIPSISEQQKIAAVLNTCDKEIELLNKQLDALKEQKKGLMQKLLTGQIRVKL